MNSILDYFKENNFNQYQMRDFMVVCEKLQSEHPEFDDDWMTFALNQKKASDWQVYGFNLFFKDQFQNWINSKYKSKKIEEKYSKQMDNIEDLFKKRFGG